MASNGTGTPTPTMEAPTPTPSMLPDEPHVRAASPVVAFIIGFSIIMIASLLNAGGLNLTKLDHVRTMNLPKGSRRKDFMRPLWVLGMLLYILSQLIGSSLALEYMRAEYVAPLGSSSLIFNFLFASLLIGTPVTKTDIYGTAVVILGVIGIVAFGSINSGLKEYFSLELLSHLWARPGWIGYFVVMTCLIILQYICNVQLEAVYIARSEISVLPSHRTPGSRGPARTGFFARVTGTWEVAMKILRDFLESWTASKDDKTVAWTLGIGWACGGGAMAGGSLVFAKATVKLISGSLNHTNTGNQFVHPAAIFTFILLALSAVFQIVCLNRGLKVYDSTLVVPMFYAIYTASGFLNSLIFMDEVDAYKPWTLFAVFMSIVVLIGGVVLLTNKKPEPKPVPQGTILGPVPRNARRARSPKAGPSDSHEGEEEDDALHVRTAEDDARDAVLWQIGDDEDEEDDGLDVAGKRNAGQSSVANRPPPPAYQSGEHDVPEEVRGLMSEEDHGRDDGPPNTTAGTSSGLRSSISKSPSPKRDDDDEFGDWEDGAGSVTKS